MQIEVRGISHRYGYLHVLDDVSFTVRAGETFALIGPSGCGKSTLLGIMGGMLRSAAGTVAASGAPPEGCLNPFTYVFQDFALLPWRTVEGNVALALEHHALGAAEMKQRIGAVLALCGLADFARAYPKQLSGGMRQRVGIARALAVEPQVLLMDEPFGALDAQIRQVMGSELLKIWERGRKTILFVTHDIDEAIYLADRIVVMSASPGRVIADLKVTLPRPRPLEIRNDPAFTAYRQRIWDLLAEQVLASNTWEQPAAAATA